MGTNGRARRGSASAQSITNAQLPLTAQQSRRMRTYLIQMGIRLVCFVGAVVAGGGVLTWVLIGAAIVLPYTAVIFANAGRDRVQYTTSPVELRAIAAGGDAGALGSADPGDSDRPGGDGPGADGPGGDGIGPSPNDKEHE